MAIHVIRPGMLTTVQDTGRWGYQSRGVPVAGPMDPVSHRLANALIGNDPGAATLEITLLGPELEFESERIVAIAGAEFDVTVDERSAPVGAAFVVAAGTRLRFGARARGSRAYLAISGGVAVPEVLGSRATHVISAMGGIDGRPLRAGDRLPLGAATGARAAAPPADRIVPLPDNLPDCASWPDRSASASRRTRSTRSNRRPTRSRRTPIAWGSVSRDRS